MQNNHYIPREAVTRSIIHAIWQVAGFPVFRQEQILPKGVVEIIFNFSEGSPIPAQFGDRAYHLPNCFINGFNSAPIQVQLPQQQTFFGVMLQPFAVKKILGVPAGEFADTTVDLTLFDKHYHSLWQQLAEVSTFDQRVNIFLIWLHKKLIDFEPREQFINHFLYAPGQHNRSVTEVATAVCYSHRQLSRKILEATGMNTEAILLYKK